MPTAGFHSSSCFTSWISSCLSRSLFFSEYGTLSMKEIHVFITCSSHVHHVFSSPPFFLRVLLFSCLVWLFGIESLFSPECVCVCVQALRRFLPQKRKEQFSETPFSGVRCNTFFVQNNTVWINTVAYNSLCLGRRPQRSEGVCSDICWSETRIKISSV